MEFVKKFSKIMFWIVLVIIAIYSTFIIAQRLIWKDKTPSFFGYKNFIVITGSMKPTLNEGDIVFVKESKEIQENDIIAFREQNSVVTHRVFEVYKENGEDYYITKGDANSGTDTRLLSISDVEGKYVFKIPFVGRIILFLQKPVGIIVLFAILLVALAVSSIKPNKKETI